MCLIISRPAGGFIPPAHLSNAACRNPDGWGVMWTHKGRIQTSRGMKPNALAGAIQAAGKRALHVHLRYATHGAKNTDNCHPFVFGDGRYALMHNGVLSGMPEHDPRRSDTWHFANYVLEPMLTAAPNLFDSAAFPTILETIVGAGNKLVILRADGATIYANHDEGVQRDGLWLSNLYSIAPVQLSPPARATSSAWPGWSLNDWPRAQQRDLWKDDELEDVPSASVHDVDPNPYLTDLFDLYDVERDDIIALCQTEPETIADLIQDALASYGDVSR